MSSWDLATRDNWDLILRENRIATQKTEATSGKYFHNPISPIYTNPSSHILLIGTKSEYAKPHWYLGATASQYLYVSPSMTSGLISGVQASDIKKIGLNKLTLVKFENYDISPYILQLEIPYWLEDIYVEVWQYQSISSGNNDESYNEILNKLDTIEAKFNAIEDYGV